MKKRLLWLPILLLVTGAAIYRPVKETLSKQAPVSQSISFAVYKGNNYTSEVYNNTSAQIHITVEKVSGNNRSKVWDKTFDAKQLKQYPSIENALSQKEHLEVTYTLTYNSKGSELRMQNGTVVSGDLKSGKVDISI